MTLVGPFEKNKEYFKKGKERWGGKIFICSTRAGMIQAETGISRSAFSPPHTAKVVRRESKLTKQP